MSTADQQLNLHSVLADYNKPVILESVGGDTRAKINGGVSIGVQESGDLIPGVDSPKKLANGNQIASNIELAPKSLGSSGSSSVSLEDLRREDLQLIEQKLNSISTSDAAILLARLIVELSQSQNREALNDQLSRRLQARGELRAAAGQLKDAADDTKRGALNNLIVTGAFSVGTLAAAGFAVKHTMVSARANMPVKPQPSELSLLDKGTATKLAAQPGFATQSTASANSPASLAKNGEASRLLSAKAHGYTLVGNTVNSIGQSSANMASARYQSAAQIHQARQSDIQAGAEVTKSEGDFESAEQQGLSEAKRQMLQAIKEILDAEVEKQRAITSA